MKNRSLNPLPILDTEILINELNSLNIKPIHASKIWRHLIQHKNTFQEIKNIPDLSHQCIDLINKKFALSTSKVISRKDAKDGSTTKLLIQLQDGQKIESVIMRYGQVQMEKFPINEFTGTFKSKGRATLCVSSQVGCSMGCTFCATGTMGLISNLSCGEILEQLMHANEIEPIRNVVFMGMGEPLDNYSQVLEAIRAMTDVSRFGLSPSRISVSTVGVVPRIYSLIKDVPQVGLALSLHAPNQQLRSIIVPSSKAWHIDRIMEAMDAFIASQNMHVSSTNRKRHILVEYVLIKDVNDSDEIAHELGELLQTRNVLLNVIPYNPTAVPYDYKAPKLEQTRHFLEIVKEYGVKTMQRQELGQDIGGACGQLVVSSGISVSNSSKSIKHENQGNNEIKDIEDFTGKSLNSSKKQRNGTVKQKKSRIKELDVKMQWIGYFIALLIALLILKWIL